MIAQARSWAKSRTIGRTLLSGRFAVGLSEGLISPTASVTPEAIQCHQWSSKLEKEIAPESVKICEICGHLMRRAVFGCLASLGSYDVAPKSNNQTIQQSNNLLRSSVPLRFTTDNRRLLAHLNPVNPVNPVGFYPSPPLHGQGSFKCRPRLCQLSSSFMI